MMSYLVTDCEFNRYWCADLIGKVLDAAPSYCAVRPIQFFCAHEQAFCECGGDLIGDYVFQENNHWLQCCEKCGAMTYYLLEKANGKDDA
jgi:hypothetical protein